MFGWGQKESEPNRPAPAPLEPADREDKSTAFSVFPKFLGAMGHVERPVLLDLGPVVGGNVEFFGERLGCKLHIENLFLDIEEAARSGDRDGLEARLLTRLEQGPDSVDGILCWDVFDFLEAPVGMAVAARLTSLLREGGAAYGFFGTTPIELKYYTRYIIDREDRFRLRRVPATPSTRVVRMTRDITKLFEPSEVTDSVLLKTSTRETLFRRQR